MPRPAWESPIASWPWPRTASSFTNMSSIPNGQSSTGRGFPCHCGAQLGEIEEAVRRARALSGRQRDLQLSNLVRELARSSDVAGALRLAESLETSEQRLEAIAITAGTIGDRRPTR